MPQELLTYWENEDHKRRAKPVETKFGVLHERWYTVPTEAFDTMRPAQGSLMLPDHVSASDALSARVQTVTRGPKAGSGKCYMIVKFHELQAVSSRA